MRENHKHEGIFQTAAHTNLAACCLTVPLSHNGWLAEFCIYQAIKRHNIQFYIIV
jgi:hypothetical protein